MPKSDGPAEVSWETMTRSEHSDYWARWTRDKARIDALDKHRYFVWHEGLPQDESRDRRLDAAFNKLGVAR